MCCFKKGGFWNTLKARWYQKGLKYSTLPKTALDIILPETKDCKTFLDIGSGCGTFAIPLANVGKKVTAIDPSRAMVEILNEEIKNRKIKNIKTINASWGEVKVKPHDAVICANVPELLKSKDFLRDISMPVLKGFNSGWAKKMVFLIGAANPNADKFYYKELYPVLFNKEFPPKTDYMETYNALHSFGIFANINIIDYNFDQPFDDMEDALEFWKEHLGIVTEEYDEKLRRFLKRKLEKRNYGLIARFRKKSAIIWWRKV